MDEKYISQLVESVIKAIDSGNVGTSPNTGYKGVFDTMTEALEAVQKAYKQYRGYTVEQREKMISNIRKLTLAEAETMAKLGVEETGMGRVEDKII